MSSHSPTWLNSISQAGQRQVDGAIDDDLKVYLTPNDVESAQVAGVQFARALAGAPAAFMIALGEQEQIVLLVIADAGFGSDVARIAADSFKIGAKLEWRRITSTVRMGARERTLKQSFSNFLMY